MKQDAVTKGLSSIQQATSDALGDAYDTGSVDGAAAQQAVDGKFTQADIDLAVSQAQTVDAKAFSDAKDASDAAINDLQGKLSALSSKEDVERSTIAGLQSAVKAVQDAANGMASLLPGSGQ